MKKVKKTYLTRFCAKQKNLSEERGGPCEARELIVKGCYKLG